MSSLSPPTPENVVQSSSLKIPTDNVEHVPQQAALHLKSVGNSSHTLDHAIYRFAAITNRSSKEELKPDWVISKALTSHPSDSVKHSLEILHSRLLEEFKDISDETLICLLDDSRQTSRSGFTTIAELKKFLHQPTHLLSSNTLINGLETLITAIAYRSIRAKSTDSTESSDAAANNIKITHTIDKIVQDKLIPSLSAFYPELLNNAPEKNTQTHPHDLAVSPPNALDDNNADHKQLFTSSPRKKFIKSNRSDSTPRLNDTNASAQGVYIRVHVSGIVVLCCAVIDALMQSDNSSTDNAANLYTTLLIPYFHSIAETQASIDYYLAERDQKKNNAPYQAKISLAKALKAMIQSTSDRPSIGSKISPRRAMANFVKKVYAKEMHLLSQYTDNDDASSNL